LGRQTPEIATQSQTEAFWWSPKTAASEMANKKEVIMAFAHGWNKKLE